MSDKIKDGGPAFPVSSDDFRDLENHPCKGMSLRDWFAGMALAHLCQGVTFDYTKGACNHSLAERAYAIADAMLTEREKGTKP